MPTALPPLLPLRRIPVNTLQNMHDRRRQAERERRAELLGGDDPSVASVTELQQHPHNNNVSHVLDFKQYSLDHMVIATDSFHPSNLLGQGSNGQVFRGILDGEEIAVKRLPVSARRIAEEEEQFVEEIRRIGGVNHRNIMQLLGFCLEGESPLLVSKKLYSLDEALYEDRSLNWEARYQVARDVAKALAYLHTGTRVQMLHCDIKPGNILLDRETMRAYIADFGLVHLARGQGAEEIEISWYYGTRGYRAPEVRSRKRLSAKSDVYSYGKLLYALLSSKVDVELMPPSLVRKKGRPKGFVRVVSKVRIWFLYAFPWIRVLTRRCKLREIDRRLEKGVSRSGRKIVQMAAALRLVALCTQSDPSKRPSMETVSMELENANLCDIQWSIKWGVAMGFGWYRLLASFLCFSMFAPALFGALICWNFALIIAAYYGDDQCIIYGAIVNDLSLGSTSSPPYVQCISYRAIANYLSLGWTSWPLYGILLAIGCLGFVLEVVLLWILSPLNYLDELLYWSPEEDVKFICKLHENLYK